MGSPSVCDDLEEVYQVYGSAKFLIFLKNTAVILTPLPVYPNVVTGTNLTPLPVKP